MNPEPTFLDRARHFGLGLRERMTRFSRMTRLLLLGLVVLTATLIAALSALSPDPTGRMLTLTQLDQMNKAKRVISANVLDEDHIVQGVIGPGEGIVDPGPYYVNLPANDATSTAVIAALQKNGTWVTVFPQNGKGVVRLLTTAVLPILILANLFALFFSARSGALSDIESFGQLEKAGTVGGSVSFKDVAGVEEAQEELREVVDYLRNPERYAAVGAVPPKGVLLFGPPGCGKTLLARAVAGEAGVPFFSVAAAEFVESLVGVGAARVRDLFARVRALAPAIVFIDELDAAGRRRGTGGGGGGEERDTTLNQLLVEMDGFEVSQGIVVIAATNRPDILDPALLRPGRFDRHVVIERPDVERREQILRLHAARRPIAPDVDFGLLARQTPGFSGADLANVLNEAALLTIRTGAPVVDAATLSEAVERVLGGPQRRGHLLTEEERRRVACHEAGHAVAAALLGQAEKVHRVSIVARGRTLGSAGLERDDAEAIRTVSQMRGRIAIALAGRAAEELAFGEASTGAADDLQHATRLAREMAGRHGLAPELGLLAYEGGGLEDDPIGIASEASWAALDDAARRILDEAHDTAGALLQEGSEHFETLTATLLELEQLEGGSLMTLLPDPLPDARVRQLLGTAAAEASRAKSKSNGGAKRG